VATRLLPWVLAVAAGAALVAAQPPVSLGVLGFAVPVLFLAAVIAQARAGRPTWPIGAVAGVVAYGAILHWLITPAGIVAWVGLSLVQAIWWAVLAGLLGRWTHHPALPVITALLWVGVDAWRGSFPLGGFAWATLATTQVDNGWLVPVVRVAGEKALTLVMVAVAVAAFEAVRRPLEATRDGYGRIVWSRLRATLPAGQVGAALLAGTVVVITLTTVEPPATEGTADVLLVQGNDLDPGTTDGLAVDESIAETTLAETRRAITGHAPDLTVWPESTIDRDPSRSPVLTQVLVEGGAVTEGRLLASTNLDGPRPRTWFNTVQVIGPDGAVTDRYVKRHLVPFGEYVPLRPLLDWFEPLRQVPRDGIPGEAAMSLAVGDVRVAVGICFESLFPRVIRSNLLADDTPADLVVISTNDASFGRTGEPMQHLAQARLRALETGRWVAFASIAGRSAFVDPEGRIQGLTDLYTVDHLRAEVPLARGRTPFLVTGDWLDPVTRALVVVAIVHALVQRRRRRQEA
jgi:apolipoprotein N-acyltransferase